MCCNQCVVGLFLVLLRVFLSCIFICFCCVCVFYVVNHPEIKGGIQIQLIWTNTRRVVVPHTHTSKQSYKTLIVTLGYHSIPKYLGVSHTEFFWYSLLKRERAVPVCLGSGCIMEFKCTCKQIDHFLRWQKTITWHVTIVPSKLLDFKWAEFLHMVL